jgi:O-Antigen ligase
MREGQGQDLTATSAGDEAESSPREWIVAAVAFGLMLVEGVRQGGFWQADALVAAVAASGLLAAACVLDRPDRRGWWVILAVVSLALWWLVRAQTSGSLSHFLPLGASFLAFAAGFAAVRPLRGRARDGAALGVACLGGAGALVGFAGLIWRWFPEAMPAQGLWRLSTTLTYADAAGLVLGVCLLLALGTDLCPVLIRMSVCLCTAGLLATQSRGAYVAVLCACCIVPWRRYVRQGVPLVAGVVLGLVAIVSSPDTGRVPWLGAALILAVAVAAVAGRELSADGLSVVTRGAIVLLTLCAAAAAILAAHHEIGLRALSPSDQDRSVEWSSALHQWKTAPIVGVGPDRILEFHARDGTFAHFVHNEYLQIAADSGVIGVALLALAVLSVIWIARRSDVLASCATSALVCWAVAAAFDFDWHLTFVGFLGGWCLGLASYREEVDEDPRPGGHRRRSLGSGFRGRAPAGRRVAR